MKRTITAVTRGAAPLVLLAAWAASCATSEPFAEIVSATPESLVTSDDARDDLTLRVRYSDPDGDLGGGLLRVHDCRAATLVTELDVPPIASEPGVDAGIVMEGELTVVLSDVGAVAVPTRSSVCRSAGAPPGAFCVVLVDASGNESEPACTGALAVE